MAKPTISSRNSKLRKIPGRPVSPGTRVIRPPAVTDLRWVHRTDKSVHFEWTNPGHSEIPVVLRERNGACHDFFPVRYDVRFWDSQASQDDIANSKRVQHRWEEQLDRRVDPGSGSVHLPATIHSTRSERRCQLILTFSKDPKITQFRERKQGGYRLRYTVDGVRWSPFSNLLGDYPTPLDPTMRVLQMRVAKTFGTSLHWAVAKIYFEICAPNYPGYVSKYHADLVGTSESIPVSWTMPASKGWTGFKKTPKLGPDGFTGKGIRVLSQGVAVGVGVDRSTVTIHGTAIDAVLDTNIIGRVEFGFGLVWGVDATGLQTVCGEIRPGF